MNVLSFGEIVWDIYPDKEYVGGAPLNFAAHLAKHKHHVCMASSVGNDLLGRKSLDFMDRCDVFNRHVYQDEYRSTGTCTVTLTENGIPRFDLAENVAYDDIPLSQVMEDYNLLYFGTLALRSEKNREELTSFIREKKIRHVFVDLNIRSPFYSKESVMFAISEATILKMSSEDLGAISSYFDECEDHKQFARLLAGVYTNLKVIIVTLGEDGSFVLDCRNHLEYECPIVPCEVRSTVGAGDSYSAGFVHQYVHRKPIPECMEYASRLASFVVSKVDAIPDYSPEDI